MRGRRVLSIGLVAVLAVGCTGDGGGSDTEASTTSAVTVDPSVAKLTGTEVLASVGPSVALVETPIGAGSGVLLAEGYLVTSAHVVDPFGSATVTFEGQEPEEIPLVGVDLESDIAVLGPTGGGRPPQQVEDAAGLEVGTDLYLVGYPGDSADAEVTIARGVLSRRRSIDGWGLAEAGAERPGIELLQTDAAIGSGQSGGALVDDQGRLVGISGFSYDESFALAIAGESVAASVAAIVDGRGTDWTPLPAATEASSTEEVIDLDGGPGALVYVPGGAPDGTLTVETAPGAMVQVDDVTWYPVAVNEAGADTFVDQGFDPTDPGLPEATEAAQPGRWAFEVPPGEPLLVAVAPPDDLAAAVSIGISEPFVVLPAEDPDPIAVGDVIEGWAGSVVGGGVYELALEPGAEVQITASSPLGDVDLSVYDVDDPDDEGVYGDDGAGGVFDLDAEVTVTADGATTFTIEVGAADGISTAYRLSVTAV